MKRYFAILLIAAILSTALASCTGNIADPSADLSEPFSSEESSGVSEPSSAAASEEKKESVSAGPAIAPQESEETSVPYGFDGVGVPPVELRRILVKEYRKIIQADDEYLGEYYPCAYWYPGMLDQYYSSLAESSGYREWVNRYLEPETRDEAEKEFLNKYLPGFKGKLDQLPFIWPLIRMCDLTPTQVAAAYDLEKNAVYKQQIETNPYEYQATILFWEEIVILCSNNIDDIMKYLKAESAFYYDGRLYSLYNIRKLPEETLKEMDQNSRLTEFLENTVKYIKEYTVYCDWIVDETEKIIEKLDHR